MTVQLPKRVEEELRLLAERQGRPMDALIQEAVGQYLEAAAITDTSADEVAATQEALMDELTDIPAWGADRT